MYQKTILIIASILVTLAGNALSQQTGINILPQPKNIIDKGLPLVFNEHVKVYLDPQAGLSKEYVTGLLMEIGFKPTYTKKGKQADLLLKRGKVALSDNKEAYQLVVEDVSSKKTIAATANEKAGLIYALQSLRQITQVSDGLIKVPACIINDVPYVGWRAFMLDEGRHFHGKTVVKKLLDEMVRLKLNTFHWHLVDDPAWRIEIKKYPLLTEVASKGDHTHMAKGINPAGWDSLYNNKPGLYYTQEDIREIVKYADDRGILIIPEIEVPGHASASIYAYPWLGASSSIAGKPVHGDLYKVIDPEVEGFLHDVLDEIIALFPGKIVHIGGDEANYAHWQNSPEITDFMKANDIPTYADLQVWAINRMSRYISSKGYRMIGWNEITGDNIRGEEHIQASQSEKLAQDAIVQFWDGDVSLINKAIEKGYDVVNSNRFFTYIDYPYEVTSFEKAYSFNLVPEGIAEENRHKILGLGCQMWGEFTPNVDRLYYQIFPRIAAYAECGWVAPEEKTSYSEFLARFSTIEDIWKEMGYLKEQLGAY